jgi:hypothetical protein
VRLPCASYAVPSVAHRLRLRLQVAVRLARAFFSTSGGENGTTFKPVV